MTDRDLLEAAAKAAGIRVLPDPNTRRLRDCTGAHPESNLLAMPLWNPLTDDGDALRLAVKLGLLVDLRYTEKHESMRKFNRVNYWPTENGTYLPIEFGEHDDPAAATRRAIVRAAAEIGRSIVSA